MQGYSYSIFSLVAIVLHLIINWKYLIGKGEVSKRAMHYRSFLFGTLAYYISDAVYISTVVR